MTFDIDVQLAVDGVDLPLADDQMTEQLDSWVKAALTFPQTRWLRSLPWQGEVSFQQAAQLTVRIVGTEEATALNQNYRQSSGPTNVLSFPFDLPFQCQPPLLGDVVICAPRVADEARQQGKSLLAHWAHLVVHGVLHLLGYDHLDERQAQEMEGLEVLILEQLAYPDPYVDHSNGQDYRQGRGTA